MEAICARQTGVCLVDVQGYSSAIGAVRLERKCCVAFILVATLRKGGHLTDGLRTAFGLCGHGVICLRSTQISPMTLILKEAGREHILLCNTRRLLLFPENLECMAPKSMLIQKPVHEKPGTMKTLKTLHNLAKVEPDIEIVCNHDYRTPGRCELAPAYYE